VNSQLFLKFDMLTTSF